MKKNILFVCRDHSAIAPMAAALVNRHFNEHFIAFSTGIYPGKPSPLAIEALGELGIEIPEATPPRLEYFLNLDIHLVITVCQEAKMQCPKFPGARGYAHKHFPDPRELESETPHEEVRGSFKRIRDEIFLWLGKYFR